MAPERHTQDSSRSRHTHRSRRDRDETSSVDSGYGGSAANSPKETHDVQKDALRDYHTESAKHHADSGRRSSRSDESKAAESKGKRDEKKDSESDSDYDPRDKYYLKVDDEEYNNMTSVAADPAKDDRVRRGSDRDRRDDRRRSDASEGHRSERRRSSASERDRRDRRERRESDASSSSRRNDRDRNRERERERDQDRDRDRHNSEISRRHSTTSDGSDSSERRNKRHSSTRHSDTSSTRSESRDRKQLRRRSDASTASHSRHDSNYRSLSPIPSDSWDESEESPERSSPRRRATSRSSRARSEAGGSRTSPEKRSSKSRDASARYIDPDGEAAKSFLDKITKGVDMKSVGKVGLDAAAVAAIKIAVGTQVPWKQRIPRTITVGAAAAIMDFVVKKTNFKPKGMIGTIYARQFVEIILANLIINPVSSKVTGAAANAKGKVAAGKPGAGGRRK